MNIIVEKLKKSIAGSVSSYVVLLGLIGVIFISIGELSPEKSITTTNDDYYENYKINTEKQLKNILGSVDGAGDVDVMITLESGKETVYAQQEKTVTDKTDMSGDKNEQQSSKNTYENEFVMVEENNQKQALVEKVLEPVVQGVVVVCSGADDVSVVSDITNAVCVALNVTSNRVCVIKMK